MDDVPENAVRDEYAALAQEYDRRWHRYLAATHTRTLAALAPEAGESILDIGCGTGLALARLASTGQYLRLYGLDASSEMLARARSRLPSAVLLMHGDASRLPFAAARFDAVFTASTLHYLDDPSRGLSEAARVLVPGGRLIVTDWCRDFRTMALYQAWLRRRRAPGRILRAVELIAHVETAGLQLESLTRFRTWPLWGLMTLRAGKPTAAHAP